MLARGLPGMLRNIRRAGYLTIYKLTKPEVKVPGNFSDIITGLSNLTAVSVDIVESANCSKQWDERNLKNFNMLLNERPCNLRGRSLPVRKDEGSACLINRRDATS